MSSTCMALQKNQNQHFQVQKSKDDKVNILGSSILIILDKVTEIGIGQLKIADFSHTSLVDFWHSNQEATQGDWVVFCSPDISQGGPKNVMGAKNQSKLTKNPRDLLYWHLSPPSVW